MPFLDKILKSKPATSHHNKRHIMLEDAIDPFWHYLIGNKPEVIAQKLLTYKRKAKVSDDDFEEFTRELWVLQRSLKKELPEDKAEGTSTMDGPNNRLDLSVLDAIDSFMYYSLTYTPVKMAEHLNQYYEQYHIPEEQQLLFRLKVREVIKLLSEMLDVKKEIT